MLILLSLLACKTPADETAQAVERDTGPFYSAAADCGTMTVSPLLVRHPGLGRRCVDTQQ